MRLIDADKLKKMRFSYGYNNDGELLVPLRDVMRAIDQAPTVKVMEKKRDSKQAFERLQRLIDEEKAYIESLPIKKRYGGDNNGE